MSFLPKSKKESSAFLVIDIGSDSVKSMMFEVERGETGHIAAITGVGNQPLLEESTRGGIIVDIDDVEQALQSAITESRNGNSDVVEAVFGVSGMLSIGFMTTARIVRGKKSAITEKEYKGMADEILDAAYDKVQNILLEMTGSDCVDVHMITSSTVRTLVDGEAEKDFVGCSGQKVEVTVFTAFTPSHHLDSLVNLSKKLGLKMIAVGPTMRSLVKSLEFSKGKGFDGVIMDIGGELTDVGVVFGGDVVATKSLDIGGTHFTWELSKNMDLTYEDAERKKLEYSFGRLSDSENILTRGYMDGLLDIWLNGMELLFGEFTGVKTFASNVYMVGGGAELPDIYEVASKEPWTRSIPFKSPPEFSKLSIEDLVLVVDRTGKAHSMADIVPASLSYVFLEAGGYLE